MNLKPGIRGALIGIVLAIVGITVHDWRGWFALIALNLIALIR
jgi:hypothetical protein